ncbi:MAG: aldehyde ferredoxin oxidoreductase family protein [Asgard group archaeon]|nr:aldehyde ferredoxin oxidoreductase family protein [Asgard group archaeon]
MTGYRGKIIRVNLNEKTYAIENLDYDIARKFVGGSGLGAYYYYKDIEKKEIIPLPFDSENKLYFLTGPLTGLPAHCTSRSSFCARSPLTSFWGESNVGGKIGPALKSAGYDGVIIEGISKNPVILLIDDNTIKIIDGSKYWGKGTYYTQENLIKELGSNKFEIACIGPAGENLVKYACIMTYGGRAAGRTGLGAVMGSKKLKAIAIKGTNTKYDLPIDFRKIADEAHNEYKSTFSYELFHEFGTSGYIDVALEMYGDMPIKNWSQGIMESAHSLSGVNMNETILVGRKACYRCPIACGREIKITEGRYKLEKIDGPEFETCASFGTNLLIDDLEAVSFANFKANDYGIDTMSSGATIGVLFDLVEKDFIPKEDLPTNIKCEFGDVESLFFLLDAIIERKGIGNLLAEGSKALAEHYNHLELAPQVAGLEAAFHDPRAFSGMAISYVTSPRGACHLNGDAYLIQQGLIFPEIAVDDLPDSRFDNKNLAQPLANLQSYRQMYNAIGLCQFYNPSATKIAELLSMAMNAKIQSTDLILIGERLFALKRLINLKLGWRPELEKLPFVMLQSLEGPTKGNVPDVGLQLKEWYEYRNYDMKTGRPSDEKLLQLGLK